MSFELREKTLTDITQLILSNSDLSYLAKNQTLSESTLLDSDLGFDSIMTISFLCELQERYPSITLNEESVTRWKSLSDVVDDLLSLEVV